MADIRRCRVDELPAILAIVNAAAEAYRGVIPDDRWREPYMDPEELGTEIVLRRYIVRTEVRFTCGDEAIGWRTHVFTATTAAEDLVPTDTIEIAAARWGTVEELAGPIRAAALATGRGLWRYRVALHDAAIAALGELR